VKLYAGGSPVRSLEIWKGSARTVKVGVGSDLFVTVPKGEAASLKAELVSQQPLIAPLTKGQRVGVLRVTHDGKPFGEVPLIALEPVAHAGFFRRTWDTLRLWLK
jgi:D-alanyl-D-alanine carboxypeptidase (penicillin-binding protein 5/6)